MRNISMTNPCRRRGKQRAGLRAGIGPARAEHGGNRRSGRAVSRRASHHGDMGEPLRAKRPERGRVAHRALSESVPGGPDAPQGGSGNSGPLNRAESVRAISHSACVLRNAASVVPVRCVATAAASFHGLRSNRNIRHDWSTEIYMSANTIAAYLAQTLAAAGVERIWG